MIAMRVLAVVPAFNEEESLPALLAEIQKVAVDGVSVDAVVVNDASTDATEQAARNCGAAVLSLPANLGIGGAVQTGFLHAVRKNYDAVVQIDGDGQHDPAQIRHILAPILAEAADCVIGSRYHRSMPDGAYRTPLLRRLGMLFSTRLLQMATGLHISDTTSGFRALNRKAFTFFATRYPTDHPEAEALLILHQAGFRIVEVPVTMRLRTSGQSLFSLFRAAAYPLRVSIGFLGIVFKGPQR
jgi:glycosyltransferase involved in cell wall biosynthesis